LQKTNWQNTIVIAYFPNYLN